MGTNSDTLQRWTYVLSDKERELLVKSVVTCYRCCHSLGYKLRKAVYENSQIDEVSEIDFEKLPVKCLVSLTHASEIIAYCSDNRNDRTLFIDIYKKLMKWFCMKPESEEAMHYRLADNRKYVYVRSILRRCRESGEYYLVRLNEEEETQYSRYLRIGKVEADKIDRDKLNFLVYGKCDCVHRKDFVEISVHSIDEIDSMSNIQKRSTLYDILSNRDDTHSLAEKLYYISRCDMEDGYYIGSDNKVKRR